MKAPEAFPGLFYAQISFTFGLTVAVFFCDFPHHPFSNPVILVIIYAEAIPKPPWCRV